MNFMNDSGDFQDGGNEFLWTVVSSFQLSFDDSEFSFLCSAATKDCRLTHGINLDYRKTFLEIKFLARSA